MNEEYLTGIQFSLGLLGIVLATTCYWLGGRSGKWRRRYLGSFILALTINLLFLWRGAWNPWYIASYPALIIAYSMGYGGTDILWQKVVRRSIYASASVLVGIIFCLVNGGNSWVLFGVHALIGCGSVALGVKNPVKATAEEAIISVLLSVMLICYPFI